MIFEGKCVQGLLAKTVHMGDTLFTLLTLHKGTEIFSLKVFPKNTFFKKILAKKIFSANVSMQGLIINIVCIFLMIFICV